MDSQAKIEIPEEEVEALFNKLSEFKKRGYFLNPKIELTRGLVRALLKNEKRFGYQLCPCRLSGGSKELDLDAVCPCDYRDQDLLQYGVCYCGLYVSKEVVDGQKTIGSIPERRPNKETRLLNKQKYMETQNEPKDINKLPYPIWRCTVCGYVCAREDAPEICPICGAAHDRFEKFI